MIIFMLSTTQAHALIGNVKVSYPENYSLELGLVLDLRPSTVYRGFNYRGPTLSFEAGAHGHKAHVGYGEISDSLYGIPITGRWTVFHMWDDDDYRHIGIQGFASVYGICGALGVMRRIDKDSYTVTLGVGIGI